MGRGRAVWHAASRALPAGGADTLFSMADQAVVSAMGFALTVLIGRFGLPSELGFYALAMSVAWLVSDAFGGLVVLPFAMRRHHCPPQQVALLRSATLVQGVAAAVLATAITLATFGGLAGPGNPAALRPGTLLAMAAAVGAVVLREQARRLRAAELDMAGAFGLDLRACGWLLAGAGVLVAAGCYSLPGMMLVVALAFAWPGGIWSAAQIRRRPPRLAEVAREAAANWREGRWILLSGFVWTLVTYAYPWLLARQHGLAASGTWAAMMSLVAIGSVPISGIQNYSGIRILAANRQPVGLTREVLGWSGFSVCLSAGFAAVLWVGGDNVVRALFGSAYAEAGSLVVLLAINLPAMAGSFPFSRALFALNAARWDVYINLAALALVLPASWATAEYGVAGAACALTASSTLCFLARVIAFFAIITARQAAASGCAWPVASCRDGGAGCATRHRVFWWESRECPARPRHSSA